MKIGCVVVAAVAVNVVNVGGGNSESAIVAQHAEGAGSQVGVADAAGLGPCPAVTTSRRREPRRGRLRWSKRRVGSVGSWQRWHEGDHINKRPCDLSRLGLAVALALDGDRFSAPTLTPSPLGIRQAAAVLLVDTLQDLHFPGSRVRDRQRH